jgi:hypothetical protein
MELGCAGLTMFLSVKRFTIIVIAVTLPEGFLKRLVGHRRWCPDQDVASKF